MGRRMGTRGLPAPWSPRPEVKHLAQAVNSVSHALWRFAGQFAPLWPARCIQGLHNLHTRCQYGSLRTCEPPEVCSLAAYVSGIGEATLEDLLLCTSTAEAFGCLPPNLVLVTGWCLLGHRMPIILNAVHLIHSRIPSTIDSVHTTAKQIYSSAKSSLRVRFMGKYFTYSTGCFGDDLSSVSIMTIVMSSTDWPGRCFSF